jgi:hypothetical protein
LTRESPDIEALVQRLPDGISVAKGGATQGIFLCRRVPTLTKAEEGAEPEWSLTPGRVEWVLKTNKGLERGVLAIDAAIESEPATASSSFTERATLRQQLRQFERDETKQLRKEVQLPLDAPSPETLCWVAIV